MDGVPEIFAIFMKQYVLLLADVIENDRNVTLKYDKVDPMYYTPTLPFIYDACLCIV